MKTPLTILSVLLVIGTVLVFAYDLKTKKYDLFSMRNIFLFGFAHFFGLGTYFTASTGFGTDLYVAGEKGFTLLFMTTIVFLIAFTFAQWIGKRWSGIRALVPGVQLPITDRGLLLCIFGLLGAGFLAALIPNTSYTTAVFSQFKGGMSAAAVALAAYNVLTKRFNVISIMLFLGTLAASMLLATVGDIGRRSLLGVFLAVGWIWYYYSLRYRAVASSVVKVAVVMSCAFFTLLMYAGFRGEGGGEGVGRGGFSVETRINQFKEAITNPTVKKGDFQSSVMSDAPTNSMFIMENYPSPYPYDPFNGIKFLISNPIPRFLWPDKPVGMGITVQKQLQSPANLGVGILGHGWAEGAWLGVIGYGLFFGILSAAIDNLIHQRMWNPYFMAAIGSSLGNVYAIARGETSLMLLQVMLSFFGVIMVMYTLQIFCKALMQMSTPALTDSNRWIAEPWDETAGYAQQVDEYGNEYTDEYGAEHPSAA